MSDKARQIEIAVQKLAGTYLKDIVSIQTCNVDSVDKANRVCECTPIGGDADTTMPGVQLCAENNNGLVVFPAVGSTVIVAQSVRNNIFVLMFSDVESIQFMDGTYGGLITLLDPANANKGILKKINNLETLLNALIVKYNTHIHPAVDSVTAAPVTVTPTATQETGTITPTVRADIENTLVTQGKV